MKKPLVSGRHQLSRLTATLSLIVVALCLLPVSPPKAAQVAKNAPTPYIEREEVRFVTVDLVAEEHGGASGRGWHPAGDLRKDQVHLLVGGREMALDVFENRCGGSPGQPQNPPARAEAGPHESPPGGSSSSPAQGGADSSTGSPRVGEPVDPSQASDASSHKYVLYFDLQHMTQGGRSAAFHSALDWAARVARPDDEVMVVNGGQSLRVIRPLQPAGGNLVDDVHKAMEDFRGVDRWADGEAGRRAEVARLAGYPDQIKAAEALARSYASIDEEITRRSLDSLRNLMALFDAIPGTKNLVFFGETVRQVPGNQYFDPIADSAATVGGFAPHSAARVSGMLADLNPRLEEVAKAANERNVRIYAVQPAGLKTGLPHGLDIEGAMTMLATETGGGYVQGTNRIGQAFDRVGQDLDCYYRLGFRMSPRHTGSTERVTVRIGEDPLRYRLHYRRTLVDPTRLQEEQDAIQAAYLAPGAAHGFPLSAAARRLYDCAQGTRFRIEISVPLEGIFLRPNPPSGSVATLRFGGQILSLRAGTSHAPASRANPWFDVDSQRPGWSFNRSADIRLPPAKRGGRDVIRVLYTTEMDVPAGDYRMVAVAEDPVTRSVSAALVDLTARNSTEVLGEPLVALRDPRTVFVDGSSAGSASAASTASNKDDIKGARSLVPAKLSLSDEPAFTGGPGELLYPVCLPAPVEPDSQTGASRPPAAGWRLLSRVVCGETSRTLPPLPLEGLDGKAGCSLVARDVPQEIWVPGPCRVETSMEGEGAPQEIRLLEVTVRKEDSPLEAKVP